MLEYIILFIALFTLGFSIYAIIKTYKSHFNDDNDNNDNNDISNCMKESWVKGSNIKCGENGHYYSACEPIITNHHKLQMKSKILCSKNENKICDGSYICKYPYGWFPDSNSNSVGCAQVGGGCDQY